MPGSTTARTEVVRQVSVLLENSSKERHGDEGNMSSLDQGENSVTGDVDQLRAESDAVKENLREDPGSFSEGS